MKILKNVSDELWLGVLMELSALWIYALNHTLLLLSGGLFLVGLFLIVIDSVGKSGEENKNVKSKKTRRK